MKLQVNRDDVLKTTAREMFEDGDYPCVLTNPEVAAEPFDEDTKRGGNLVLRWRCILLSEAGNTDSKVYPAQQFKLNLPISNPEIEGHMPPEKSLDTLRKFYKRMGRELPEWPQWDATLNKFVVAGELKSAKSEEVKEAKLACQGAVVDFLKQDLDLSTEGEVNQDTLEARLGSIVGFCSLRTNEAGYQNLYFNGAEPSSKINYLDPRLHKTRQGA